ncbi:energy-coupling factor transporter ATPase [Neobacillus sp. OS1-32]|jgi:energy-coupling factor transport system ATP-binding protein|uniref:Energy-coupling factor transporter ATP-binding protein EcfA2 n=1 Tax=Neobacillus paridis TaxID=2803862 RepID=A0ABS1TN72_9BACI|nr:MULTISPECIES: energy-coupling factor transporter ATPase [Neobacillus]MBL4952775.1 energy-coupling factor transporter ATPase [Neobacillus paridis]WML31700.1 energy-coupling factor transporter ATPase [Neobacillus sp. OS1-32]
MTVKPIIEIENLTHTYMKGTPMEHVALKGTNLYVEAGECIAIIGHTGSGKSTLIQHLNGLIRPESGRVVIDGEDLAKKKIDLKTLRRKVGIVFQNPEDQIFEKIIGDDIAYGPFKMGLPLKEVRERVKWAMSVVGLDFEEMKDRQTFALSGGQKRKVALAGILALKPKILVLDEPTAGLDPRSRNELLDKIKRLNKEEKLTVIFVSHNMEEVAMLADRVYVMADGKDVLSGTPKEIFTDKEKLVRHQIGTPETVQVLYRLTDLGYQVRTDAFSITEAADEIMKLFAGRKEGTEHVQRI